MFDLVTIGEVMAELRRDTRKSPDWQIGFAGDMFNSAVYAARNLPPGRVAFHSRIGRDPLSADFADFAQAQGVDTAHVARVADRNIGLYSVSTDPQGERSFHYWRDQSAARGLMLDPETLPAARVYLFSAITLAILSPQGRDQLLKVLAERRAETGCHIAFDSNFRPQLWESHEAARAAIAAAWEIADIALPSVDDEMAIFGDPDEASVLARFGAREWHAGALKRGSTGPCPLGAPVDPGLSFAPATHVLDTTAAGDSFNGAYLAAFLRGAPEAERLTAGHACAADVVGHSGAISPRV